MSDVSAMLSSRRLQVFAPELFQNCARDRQRDDFFFFFKKRGGSELVMSGRKAQKKRGADRGVPECVSEEYLRRQVGS